MKEFLVQQDDAAQFFWPVSLREAGLKATVICREQRSAQLSDGKHSAASSFADSLCKKDVRDPPTLQPGKLDTGSWLLYDIFARHDSWEQLKLIPQGAFGCLSCLAARRYHMVKRSCDIIGSLFFLILLLPLSVLVAILIKLDSPGPVLFRHHRIGRDGKCFTLWKFRSMRTDAPKYGISPHSTADGRLTRIGRLIRRLSIDELPQLINVLRGEMSLVGPRPEMPFIVDGYRPFERKRLAAKPGLTGLWQISPARAFPIHDNLQYDLHYIGNQNLLLDCAIILRTIAAVVRGIGAV